MTVCKELRGPGGVESIGHVVHIKRGRERDSCVECSFVQAEMKTGELTGAALSPQSAAALGEPWAGRYRGGDRLAALGYAKGCSEGQHTSNTLISKMTQNAVMA